MHQTVDHPPTTGRFRNKFILCFQYFMMGTMMHMLFSMAYTYDRLPSYNIVALFSLIGIIPNFMFILSPLIENHTSLSYGKRKTWMVISTVFKAVLVFILSYFTRQDQQIQLSAILVFAKMFLGISRTSIDGLALKQYKEKSRMSFLQTIVFKIGGFFGSLLFLKLISPTFYKHFHRMRPFLTVQQFFWVVSLTLFILAILSHFLYIEDEWNTEQIILHKSYCELIKQYKVFFDIDNTYCRLTIFYFFIHLGLACFTSGFRYVLIESYGVSRQTYVTITSLMFIGAIPLAYICSRSIPQDTIAWKLQLTLVIRLVFDALAFAFEVKQTLHLCIYYFFTVNTKYFQSIILHTMLNEISTVGLSGMFLSAASSLKMVVQNHSWSLKLVDWFGYEVCAVVGFVQQVVVVAYVPKLVKWVFEGQRPEEVKDTETSERESESGRGNVKEIEEEKKKRKETKADVDWRE